MRKMIEQMVDEMLDADGQVITIVGITFLPSQILKEMDPIAYEQEINDFIDSQIEDLQYDLERLNEEADAEEIEDLKARIEEFNALAGHELIHTGLTSRDLTENVEALQIRTALDLVHDRTVALLARIGEKAAHYSDLAITGRSHNVPAQVTTLGKRFASAGEELLWSYERLNSLRDRFPMRGIKGPVGTAQDSIDLLGSSKAHFDLETEVAHHLGFANVLDSTGQIYPRSFDFDVVTTLVQLAAAPSSLAASIRLMAGSDLVTEGFKAGQVGSSAMPHKMNTRSCERINGLAVVLRGFASMVGELAGDHGMRAMSLAQLYGESQSQMLSMHLMDLSKLS